MSQEQLSNCVVCGSKNIKFIFPIKDHSISKETFDLGQCSDCSFRFTMNPPSESSCGPYYQSDDYISHSDTSKGFIFSIYHKVRDIMLGRKHSLVRSISSSKSLLDVGSGTGYFPAFMAKNGYQVEGIEVDEKARKFSIEKFGLTVHDPEILKNKQLNQKYGVITLWHVLEHLYKPNDYMSAFYQLLDEDGYLVIAVPNHLSYDARHYQDKWAAYDVPRHLWHFNPDSMNIMAQNNGFQIESKHQMPFDPFYNSMLSEKYKASSLGIIRAGLVGMIAFGKGLLDVNKASSIVYVMKKRR